MTPRRANLVSQLYIQHIKEFKPTPIAAKDSEGIKSFALPATPAIPSEEISAEGVAAYEAVEVETEAVSSEAAPAEEDWFVFPEEEEHH